MCEKKPKWVFENKIELLKIKLKIELLKLKLKIELLKLKLKIELFQKSKFKIFEKNKK